jgi:hypothetical protein
MAQGIGIRQTNVLIDTALTLKAAGLVAASANGSLIIDLGGGGQDFTPVTWFDMIVDVTAIEVASGDEVYTIILEGSDDPAFASTIEALAILQLGAAAAATFLGNADVNSDIGRYVCRAGNLRNEHTYRYLRITTVVAGTIATGINYSAFLSKC